MYKEHFEEQLRVRIETLKSKKKDISEIKSNITKLINQKEKLVNLIISEDSEQIIKTMSENQPDFNEVSQTSPSYIKNKPTDIDAVILMSETGIVEPVADTDNAIFVSEKNELYVL